MIYNTIACGGTFDNLHAGHKTFLRWIFSHAHHVLIGLTSDAFVQSEKKGNIQIFTERKKVLEEFLQEEGFFESAKILEIHEVYGPLLDTTLQVDAIAVTKDTQKGAEIINIKRALSHLPVLPVLVVPLEITTTGDVISSSNIRKGKIDRSGNVYIKPEWEEADYLLPHSLREELQKPFGKLLLSLPENINSTQTITVGDETTRLCNTAYKNHRLSIVDFVVERSVRYHKLEELGFSPEVHRYTLVNDPGHITKDSWFLVQKALLQEQAVITVTGEEDLLVLVCILCAPLGYVIYYGQPKKGIVEITVTLDVKSHAFKLMSQFRRI